MAHTANYHLGFSEEELASSPYARFFNEEMAPLPEHVREALLVGAVAHELLPPIERAHTLQEPGYWPVETGYSICPDGAAHINVLTEMPDVTPAMWDWWFAWHGSDSQRYKLWHPAAHVYVGWQDGRSDLDYYVGRVSNVVEYVGATPFQVTIRFVSPASLGLNEQQLKSSGETAICARIGMSIAGVSIESGWLVHHIRPGPGGSEMRSRFWLGGSNVRVLGLQGTVGASLGKMASRLQPITFRQITELMVHDAHEMNHLAAILPALFAAFSNADQ